MAADDPAAKIRGQEAKLFFSFQRAGQKSEGVSAALRPPSLHNLVDVLTLLRGTVGLYKTITPDGGLLQNGVSRNMLIALAAAANKQHAKNIRTLPNIRSVTGAM